MPREYRDERLVRVLREQLYASIEGVQEAVIVTNDGLVVAAYPGAVDEQDAHSDVGSSHWVAAMAAEIMAQSRRAFVQLDKGAIGRILVDGESGGMIVVPANDHAALAVMVTPHAKLGIAMFQIARIAEQIAELLE